MRHRSSIQLTTTLVIATLLVGCVKQNRVDTLEDWRAYGDAVPVDSTVHIAALGAMNGETTAIEGWVEGVCMKKGCWMKVREGDDEVLVRFRDYGFFVPRNARGRRTVLEGVPIVRVFDVEQRRHLASDAGASEAEIAAITEPETQVVFMANGVWIQGGGLDDPYAPPVPEGPCPLDEEPKVSEEQ